MCNIGFHFCNRGMSPLFNNGCIKGFMFESFVKYGLKKFGAFCFLFSTCKESMKMTLTLCGYYE
jgi:hypothetical protein